METSETQLVVREWKGYSLSMPKKIFVTVKGANAAHIVEADVIEQDGPWLALRKGDNVVAKFKEAEVVGWVIKDKD